MFVRHCILAVSALLLTGCFPPAIYLGTSLGSLDPARLRAGDLSSSYPCPGEQVFVAWYCPECDSLTVTMIGDPKVLNSNPKGPQSFDFEAREDVKFQAVGKNKNGTTTVETTVDMLQSGQSIVAAAAKHLQPPNNIPVWQADLPAWAYSAKATVYQARFQYGVVPNVTVTSSWFLLDPKGSTAVMTGSFSPVANAPLVGAWRDYNASLDTRSVVPDTIGNELSVRC